jgi:hypothetical protein
MRAMKKKKPLSDMRKRMKLPKDIRGAIEEYRTQSVKSHRFRKIPPREVLEELYWEYDLFTENSNIVRGYPYKHCV